MKKNAMLKIAAILMVAVLLTTCAISSTFAKYTTQGVASDSARIAKFGVTVETNIDGLFEDAYATTTDLPVEWDDASADSTVTSATVNSDVIAPGTKNTVEIENTLKGTPEVDVKVELTAVLTMTGWTLKDSSEYFPVIFYVGDTAYGITGMIDPATGSAVANGSANMEALKGTVENAIKTKYSDEYEANTDLSTVTSAEIGWAWAIEGNNNASDTYLASLAAGVDSTTGATVTPAASSVSLQITTTVTQID